MKHSLDFFNSSPSSWIKLQLCITFSLHVTALLQGTFTSPGWGSAIIYFLSSQKVKTNNDMTSPKPRGSWTLAKTVQWEHLPQGLYAWIIKFYPLLGSLKDTWCYMDYLTFHLQKTVEFSHRLLCIHPAGASEVKSKVNTQESTVIILCNNVIFSEWENKK